MNPEHFLRHVIRPTLAHLGDAFTGPVSQALMLGTALTESNLEHLEQLGGGPAIGVYQCEPATHQDIFENFLRFDRWEQLRERVNDFRTLRTDEADAGEMYGNHYYATAIARCVYIRKPEHLPEYSAWALAGYWKRHYNTALGAGTVEKAEVGFDRAIMFVDREG